jgi:hypothetical protein
MGSSATFNFGGLTGSSRSDFSALLDPCIGLAKRLLKSAGAFLPFAYAVGSNGKVAQFGFDAGPGKNGQERVDYAVNALRSLAKSKAVRATALCFDVRITPPGQRDKSDAIEVAMEDADGTALNLFVPYRKDWLGSFQYGALFATQGALRVFVKAM